MCKPFKEHILKCLKTLNGLNQKYCLKIVKIDKNIEMLKFQRFQNIRAIENGHYERVLVLSLYKREVVIE